MHYIEDCPTHRGMQFKGMGYVTRILEEGTFLPILPYRELLSGREICEGRKEGSGRQTFDKEEGRKEGGRAAPPPSLLCLCLRVRRSLFALQTTENGKGRNTIGTAKEAPPPARSLARSLVRLLSRRAPATTNGAPTRNGGADGRTGAAHPQRDRLSAALRPSVRSGS